MAESDEKEKHANDRWENTDLRISQYCRYIHILEAPFTFKLLLSPKRFQAISWLWDNRYLNSIEPNAFRSIRGDKFEAFLVAAEKVTALRKKKKKGSSQQIIGIAAEYIITHKLIWSDDNVWEKGFVDYFLAQVLWCFFDAYPKFVPWKISDKEPLEHAVKCMLTLPDSDIHKLTTSIAILVPNVRMGSIDDLFISWVDGKLMYLSQRALNFGKHAKDGKRKLFDAGKENGSTINLRLKLASHIDESKRRTLLTNALDMAKEVYGEYHAVTWHCTEQLGDFYLNHASEYTMRDYFSNLGGDNAQGVQKIYEEFLNRAYELEQQSTLDGSEREALSILIREKVAPTVAELYMKSGKESEARKLLWKITKDKSSQIYHDDWRPFRYGSGNMGRLISQIRSFEGFYYYSDLKYSSLELVLFPFDEISLASVTPSDEEKARKWHFVFDRMPNGEIIRVGESTDWSPGLEGGYEPRTIQKAGDDTDNKENMILELPYITYSHFKTSKAYREGSTYDFYRKGSINQQLEDWMEKNKTHHTPTFRGEDYSHYFAYADRSLGVGTLVNSETGEPEDFVYDRETGSMKMNGEKHVIYAQVGIFVRELEYMRLKMMRMKQKEMGEIEKFVYDRETVSLMRMGVKQVATKELENPPNYKLLNIPQCEKQILGFFNSTPGDIAAIDEAGTVGQGFNLVSAEWYDWKRFMLHPCASSTERQPELVSTDGSPIPVLGYIYGSWTDDTLHKQWKGLQIWVVYAKFELPSDSSQDGRSCHFILNADDLCKNREHELSHSETRAICTFLNPALLRVMNHAFLKLDNICCNMGQPIPDDFAGVTKKQEQNTQRDPIVELSFRDAWDTEFAFNWWNCAWGPDRAEIMTEQLKEEIARRRKWDAESTPVFKQWVNSRK
ncbi:hypothetical protein TMatcc_006234 [Talaromyces marneffei ATCC 18224]|uniref:Uncharacterized protein n=2 Tax=Talaromyces marneffei TaxID=37727 RepID=B6QBX5_TALMQ|nr:uncharacterized protein EYB26_002808 [Talaromyces marneffei]EEA25535.1 hypothetical protein PMAA_066400 [Talaromyces marneffei ATCC 18224]KAE8554257.1 hypothetical protein EYB25_002795 [Talaromyces marneffei]QGA15152.1 hypothetical protein EYB26_002808 [Talaromyces marneffei]